MDNTGPIFQPTNYGGCLHPFSQHIAGSPLGLAPSKSLGYNLNDHLELYFTCSL